MLRWYYSVDNATILEITDRVLLPNEDAQGITVGAHAEEGSGWEGTIEVMDHDGDLIMLMHRRIYSVQDAEASGSQVVGNWFITNLDVERADPFTAAARKWIVTMADENSLLSRRVFVGAGNNRPAETDIARIRWLLTTTELNTVDPNEDFIDTTDPVQMDAVDYIGQKPEQVMSDCSQQSGKNYWVMYREDLTPNVYGLAYFNASTSDLYPSAISLSNVESEIDSTTVFAISDDTKLARAGGRSPTSGMYLPYAGGYVYEQDTTIGDAYVYRDVAAPSVNVKTAAKATVRALRLLAELVEPDDEVETEIIVGAAQVNDTMHGMFLPLHATHLPPYLDGGAVPAYVTGQDMRIMRRQVRQLAPTTFGVRLWMTPMSPEPCPDQETTPDGFYPPNYDDTPGSADGYTVYGRAGGGFPEVPTPSYAGASPWHFGVYHVTDAGAPDGFHDKIVGVLGNMVRILVVGNGTLTIHTRVHSSAPLGVYRWYVRHREGGLIIDDSTGDNVAPGNQNVTVPVGDQCNYWVDLVQASTAPGGPTPGNNGVGYAGFTWAPL